jgi:hypothetical protein
MSLGGAAAVGALTALTALAAPAAPAAAQAAETRRAAETVAAADAGAAPADSAAPQRRFASRRDSLEWVAARAQAARSTGFRVIVSLFDRRLWVVLGRDTVMTAPVAVGMDSTLEHEGKSWRFATPRGRRTVLGTEADPLWRPPEWHYVEVARARNLDLGRIPDTGAVALRDGSRLEMRDSVVGIVRPEGEFTPLPQGEEIVFDNTVFIPPLRSVNRRIPGELGRFRLDLGDGILLHGTPHTESIGAAATHGCIRLHDEHIEWLYTFAKPGMAVYVY